MSTSLKKVEIISSLPASLQSPQNEDFNDDMEPIINMQTAVYEVYIDGLQRHIEKLKNRNEELEKLCESVLNSSKYKYIEAENEFVELNMGITSETKRIDEDRKKFAELEKLREKQTVDHFKKVKQMTEHFENRRIELYSEIKELNAKINTIEDYKLVDENLRTKHKKQNESILQEEQRMQDILKEIEYKSKLHKESLKREAYKRILDTSNIFQFNLKTTIPLTEQRLMRENIVLQNELYRLQTDYDNMADKLLIHKNFTKECKKKIKKAKIDTRYRIITSKIQNMLLKKLKNVYPTVNEMLSKSYKESEYYENKYLKDLEDIQNSEYFNCEYRQRKLEVIYHQEIIKFGFINNLKSKTSVILTNLSKALSNLKKSINSTILISTLTDEEDFKKTDLEAFTFYLLNIIKNCESKKRVSDLESIQTLADARNVYIIGDLDFEPKYIEIDQMNEEIDKIILARSSSTMLKEFDKISDKLLEHKSSILSNQKSSHDSVSVGTSFSSKITLSQSNVSTKESMKYMNQKEMETILNAISDNEEVELEYETEDRYEDYVDY